MSRTISTKYKLYIILLIVAFALFACEKKAEPESEKEAEYTQVYAYASICLLYPMDMTITEYDQGIEQMEKGQFFEASASMETALERQKKEFPDNKLVEAKILSALGVCDIALFENQKAEERLRLAQELILAETGNSSDETAVAYNNLASVLLSLHGLDESLKFFLQAEEIGEKNATLAQLNIDCIAINKATVLLSQGKYLEGITKYKEYLQSIKENTDNEKLVKAFVKGKMTFLDSQSMGLSTAIKNCEDAIAVFEQYADKKHPQVTTIYMVMGLINLENDQVDKALEIIIKASDLEKNSLSQNPATIAKSYFNTGVCYNNKNQPDKAMEYYNKALVIITEYKELKNDLASVYNNIGAVYVNKGDLEQAERYLAKAYWTVYGDEYYLASQEQYRSSTKMVYEALGKDPAQFDTWLEQQKNNKEVFPDAA